MNIKYAKGPCIQLKWTLTLSAVRQRAVTGAVIGWGKMAGVEQHDAGRSSLYTARDSHRE